MQSRNNSSDMLWKCITFIAVIILGYSTANNRQIGEDVKSLLEDISELKQSVVFVREDHETIKDLRDKISTIEKQFHHWKLIEKIPRSLRARREERD